MTTTWAEETPLGVGVVSTTLGLVLAIYAAVEFDRVLDVPANEVPAEAEFVAPASEPPTVPEPPAVDLVGVAAATPDSPEPAPPEPVECAPAFKVTFEDRLTVAAGFSTEAETLTSWLAKHPDAQVLVRGHADGRGDEGFNLRLSHQRAKKVGAALRQAGVAKGRLTVQAFGEYRPQVGLNERDVRQRRVTVEVAGMPSCEEEL